MTSEAPQNRFFRPPPASEFADSEARSYVRAEFFFTRDRFLDRLAAGQVFDAELFEALLLWLDTLQACCAAAGVPMLASDFARFDTIASYLEQEATYSRDQRAECAAARERWLGVMQRLHLPST